MRNALTMCALLITAQLLCAADSFAWNSRDIQRASETINQVQLSDSDRVALNVALLAAVGPLSPNLSAEEQMPDIRVKLIDLNGDHIPEVFAHFTGRFWCGATGNCPLWVFRKVGEAYEPMLLRQEISSYQGFTVTPQRTGGYFDLIFNQHEAASWQALVVFKFREGKYRIAECHEARWEVLDDKGTTAKEPTITPCR